MKVLAGLVDDVEVVALELERHAQQASVALAVRSESVEPLERDVVGEKSEALTMQVRAESGVDDGDCAEQFDFGDTPRALRRSERA